MERVNTGLSSAHKWMQESYYQYFLVVQPDKKVAEKVMEEKEALSRWSKSSTNITAPFITIATFQAREQMEETLIRYIQRICFQQQAFNVTINNYSCSPAGSVFLRIQNKDPFVELANQLQAINQYIISCSCPPANIISAPQINLADSLLENISLQILLQYAHKSFYDQFTVNELVLLRSNGPGNYKPINISKLQPVKTYIN